MPRYLSEPPVEAKTKSDRQNPDRIEEKNTRGDKNRMAAGPLFIVVDEYVVPGEGAHVEGVEGAEDPEEWKEEEGG